VAEQLTTALPFTAGAAPAVAATLLNALDSNTVQYVAGDSIDIAGTDADGTPVTASLAIAGGPPPTTTVGDLVSAISAAFSGATASLDAQGNIVLTADAAGDAFLSLTLADAAGNTGGTDFSTHLLDVTTVGSDGDSYQRTFDTYDSLGIAHPMTFVVEKQAHNTWRLTFSMDAQHGTIQNNQDHQITFNQDGSILQVDGSQIAEIDLDVLYANATTADDMVVTLGTAGHFDGLTQVAIDTGVAIEQDGGPPGVLNTVNISADGIIEGIADNGRRLPLAQMAIASFSNVQGLTSSGNNYFELSLNSGTAQIGAGLTGGRGAVRASTLESSNVDMAQEFTRLIIAQRGFSANARTISVTNEVLEELTGLIR
jgi:flagellar hook protein FlgE